jgi:hypothetical protein
MCRVEAIVEVEVLEVELESEVEDVLSEDDVVLRDVLDVLIVVKVCEVLELVLDVDVDEVEVELVLELVLEVLVLDVLVDVVTVDRSASSPTASLYTRPTTPAVTLE